MTSVSAPIPTLPSRARPRAARGRAHAASGWRSDGLARFGHGWKRLEHRVVAALLRTSFRVLARGSFFEDAAGVDAAALFAWRTPEAWRYLVSAAESATWKEPGALSHWSLAALSQAYVLTGDERYARTFERHIGEIASDDDAEALVCWCWAFLLFRNSPSFSTTAFLEALSHIDDHAAFLERYLAEHADEHSSRARAAVALFYVGVLIPEIPGARRRLAHGVHFLAEENGRVLAEMGQGDAGSLRRLRDVAEADLHMLLLAEKNGLTLPLLERDTIRVLEGLLRCKRPDGSLPAPDGGDWLPPLTGRRPEDLRGLFSTGAAVFGRADFAEAAGGPAAETFWLLGRRGLRVPDRRGEGSSGDGRRETERR